MPKNTTRRSGFARASASASSGEYTTWTSAPRAAQREQVGIRARHAQHVTERREDDAGPLRDRVRAIDGRERGHAYRAAGAVHQLDPVAGACDRGRSAGSSALRSPHTSMRTCGRVVARAISRARFAVVAASRYSSTISYGFLRSGRARPARAARPTCAPLRRDRSSRLRSPRARSTKSPTVVAG